jgi:hypothetical protein
VLQYPNLAAMFEAMTGTDAAVPAEGLMRVRSTG